MPAAATTNTCASKRRGVSERPPTAHNRLPGGLGAPLGRPGRRRALVRGDPPKTWCLASSNMLHAFALSSAASSVRKPPESERCTTCRRVVDGLIKQLARGGGIVPSQGKASVAAFLGARPRFASGPRKPLAMAKGGDSQVARRVPTLCVAWVVTQRASGCAAQSVSTHL